LPDSHQAGLPSLRKWDEHSPGLGTWLALLALHLLPCQRGMGY
jgi:hypothetical protein